MIEARLNRLVAMNNPSVGCTMLRLNVPGNAVNRYVMATTRNMNMTRSMMYTTLPIVWSPSKVCGCVCSASSSARPPVLMGQQNHACTDQPLSSCPFDLSATGDTYPCEMLQPCQAGFACHSARGAVCRSLNWGSWDTQPYAVYQSRGRPMMSQPDNLSGPDGIRIAFIASAIPMEWSMYND